MDRPGQAAGIFGAISAAAWGIWGLYTRASKPSLQRAPDVANHTTALVHGAPVPTFPPAPSSLPTDLCRAHTSLTHVQCVASPPSAESPLPTSVEHVAPTVEVESASSNIESQEDELALVMSAIFPVLDMLVCSAWFPPSLRLFRGSNRFRLTSFVLRQLFSILGKRLGFPVAILLVYWLLELLITYWLALSETPMVDTPASPSEARLAAQIQDLHVQHDKDREDWAAESDAADRTIKKLVTKFQQTEKDKDAALHAKDAALHAEEEARAEATSLQSELDKLKRFGVSVRAKNDEFKRVQNRVLEAQEQLDSLNLQRILFKVPRPGVQTVRRLQELKNTITTLESKAEQLDKDLAISNSRLDEMADLGGRLTDACLEIHAEGYSWYQEAGKNELQVQEKDLQIQEKDLQITRLKETMCKKNDALKINREQILAHRQEQRAKKADEVDLTGLDVLIAPPADDEKAQEATEQKSKPTPPVTFAPADTSFQYSCEPGPALIVRGNQGGVKPTFEFDSKPTIENARWTETNEVCEPVQKRYTPATSTSTMTKMCRPRKRPAPSARSNQSFALQNLLCPSLEFPIFGGSTPDNSHIDVVGSPGSHDTIPAMKSGVCSTSHGPNAAEAGKVINSTAATPMQEQARTSKEREIKRLHKAALRKSVTDLETTEWRDELPQWSEEQITAKKEEIAWEMLEKYFIEEPKNHCQERKNKDLKIKRRAARDYLRKALDLESEDWDAEDLAEADSDDDEDENGGNGTSLDDDYSSTE